MPAEDRGQPFPHLGNGVVPAPTEGLLHLPQLGPKPLTHGLPHEREPPFPRLPTDVSEAEEVERLGLAPSAPLAVLRRVAAELDQAGLFGVQLGQTRSSSSRCRSTSWNSGDSRGLRGRYTRQLISTPSPRPGGESPARAAGGQPAGHVRQSRRAHCQTRSTPLLPRIESGIPQGCEGEGAERSRPGSSRLARVAPAPNSPGTARAPAR